jgi:hypothetical protein
MSVSIFTTGTVSYAKDDDGTDVMRVEFGDDAREDYKRVELTTGTRLETNGAISESFGRGGKTLEIIGLADLALRGDPSGGDETLPAEAAGFCGLTLDWDTGVASCTQGNCAGACVPKYVWGVFLYCNCR